MVWTGKSERREVLRTHIVETAKRIYGTPEFFYYALDSSDIMKGGYGFPCSGRVGFWRRCNPLSGEVRIERLDLEGCANHEAETAK